MSERTKQVQFRMPEDIHKELKIALIKNDSSLADFFNNAALAYLEKVDKGMNVTNKSTTKMEEK